MEYAEKTASEHVGVVRVEDGVVRVEDGVRVAWLDYVDDLDQLEGDKIVGEEVVILSNLLEQLAEQSAMVVHGGDGGGGGGGIQGAGETGADEMEHHSASASFLNALKMKCLEQFAELDEGYEMDVAAFA